MSKNSTGREYPFFPKQQKCESKGPIVCSHQRRWTYILLNAHGTLSCGREIKTMMHCAAKLINDTPSKNTKEGNQPDHLSNSVGEILIKQESELSTGKENQTAWQENMRSTENRRKPVTNGKKGWEARTPKSLLHHLKFYIKLLQLNTKDK